VSAIPGTIRRCGVGGNSSVPPRIEAWCFVPMTGYVCWERRLLAKVVRVLCAGGLLLYAHVDLTDAYIANNMPCIRCVGDYHYEPVLWRCPDSPLEFAWFAPCSECMSTADADGDVVEPAWGWLIGVLLFGCYFATPMGRAIAIGILCF